MAIQTRTITARFSEPYGDPIENVRVVIQLRGLGNSPNGAIAPETQEKFTDENGEVSFELWENNQSYSNTYYEVSSSHPITGGPIHRREIFRVYDSDANLAELISLGLVAIDVNQAMLDQVAADRAAAASSATSAEGYKDAAESAKDDAEAAEVAAGQHKDDAAGYASAAQQSASNASSSEFVAGQHKDAAAGSASAAATSENNARGYRDAAEGFRDQAASSAAGANTSANNAAGSASSANNSKNAAAASELAALGYKNSASLSASTATTKAGDASDSAQAASTSEGNAAGHASNASDSADQAEGYKNQAEGYKSQAEAHKNQAETYKNQALAAAESVNNIHNGSGVPSSALGDDGDYYIDNNEHEIYGPKTAGDWGSPTHLIGPQGEQGPQGIPGDTGLTLPGSTTNGYLVTWSGTGGDAMAQLNPATLATAEQGDKADTAVQPGALATVATSGDYIHLSNRPNLGSASTASTGDFAAAVQGTKADIAYGWGNHASEGYATGDNFNASGNYASLRARGTTAADVGAYTQAQSNSRYATAAQGTKADSAVQPGALATVATSGSYNNLSNRPTLGTSASRAAVTGTGDTTGNSLVDNARMAAALADVGGVTSYNDLTNKPTLGTAAAQNVGYFARASHSHNYAASNHNHSGVYAPVSHTHSEYVKTSDVSYSNVGNKIVERSPGGHINVGTVICSHVDCTGNITAYSDKRLKKEIEYHESSLDKIKFVNGATYLLKSDDSKTAGIIAQDLYKALPEAVETDDEGVLSVNLMGVIGLLCSSVNELRERVEELENGNS